MKAQERHHLKQNEFARSVARATEVVATNRDRVVMAALVVVVLVVAVGGYTWWRGNTNDKAAAMLGVAMGILESPIVPAPTVPGAAQTPNTFPTEQARHEAALASFQQVAAAYESTEAGMAARYHAASALLALKRTADAEREFQAVADGAGTSLYGAMAKMGLAETLVAAGQFDRGVKVFEELAADRDGPLPVDGVLMQLARAYLRAGKPKEAGAAFKRIVDDFPESLYVTQARQQLTLL